MSKKRVIVTGDYERARFIYTEGSSDIPANLHEAWTDAKNSRSFEVCGGAGGLARTLMEMNKELDVKCINYICEGNRCNKKGICKYLKELSKPESIFILTQQKINYKNGKNKQYEEKKNEEPKWRFAEHILSPEKDYPQPKITSSSKLGGDYIPVIIDYSKGWLNNNEIDRIKEFIGNNKYIIRTHDPKKDEWKEFREQHKNPGIWFSALQDMEGGRLSFAGNWEEIQDRLFQYLSSDKTLYDKVEGGKEEKEWKHTIVIQVDYEGAVIFEFEKNDKGKILIYAGDLPGSFLRKGYNGVMGSGMLYMATLVECLSFAKDLTQSVKKAIMRSRKIVEEGFIEPEFDYDKDFKPSILIPVDKLDIASLDDVIEYKFDKVGTLEKAKNIVSCKESELKKHAFGFGEMSVISPDYANSLLKLTSRLESYIENRNSKGIISIGIFGEPGSGKTFLAKQISKVLNPNKAKIFKMQDVNMSQLINSDQLTQEFQKIQTETLAEKIPLVLWDEFDTYYNGQRCGWLQNFLMPMQTSEFVYGNSKLSIGKSIFLFAGGTFENETKFIEWTKSDDGRKLKGRDFLSRLDSSLTIPSTDVSSGTDKGSNAMLLRAVIIRKALENKNKVKSISAGALGYLLNVKLAHGVRSLQRIIEASELDRTTNFDIIHLPPMEVLRLHVADPDIYAPNKLSRFIDTTSLKDPIELDWRKKEVGKP